MAQYNNNSYAYPNYFGNYNIGNQMPTFNSTSQLLVVNVKGEAGGSYRRGRSNTNSSYGNYDYSMDRGYSGHSVRDRMISHLESTMMDNAQSESERRTIESLISQLSSNNR